MNKVYISGTIADVPLFFQSEGGAAHLTFQICVQHKTAKGAMKRELYRVNAWNNTALWGKANLRQGQSLAVEGYLTQRIAGETGIISVEVTAEEFFPAGQFARGAETKSAQSDERAEPYPDIKSPTAGIAS